MHTQNEKFRETLCEQLRIEIRGEIEQTMSQHPTELAAEDCGPVVVPPRSSSGSNMHPVEDPSQRFPVDEITEPKPCKLYVMAGFIKTKVAMGLAMPTQEKEVLHCRELPIGYARVTLDTLVKKSYGKVELETPGQDDKVKLKDNIGCFVAWRKRYISLGDSDSDSSEDEENTFPSERVPSQPSPHSPPRKDPSPSPREQTPPPREPTPPRRPCNRSLLSDFHQSPVKTRSSQKQISTESSPPQRKLKKPVSGSITSLFPEKDEFRVPKKAVAHFQRMCMVPQTGSDKPPASDFEQITSKRSMLEFSKIKHKQTIEDRKSIEEDFCKTGSISKEDLRRLQNEDGILLPTPKLTWPFELGKDMVSPQDMGGLPTKMRKLHEWYKRQSGDMFGVRYPKELFGTPNDKTTYTEKFIEFKSIYELYQQDSLDVSILFLWCLMETQLLRKRNIKGIAFLDPVGVNEKTVGQPVTLHYLYNAFCILKDNRSILLPYNCMGHFVLLDINLLESSIGVYD
ncbi:unnamed protein product [Urochloa humidicola]